MLTDIKHQSKQITTQLRGTASRPMALNYRRRGILEERIFIFNSLVENYIRLRVGWIRCEFMGQILLMLTGLQAMRNLFF